MARAPVHARQHSGLGETRCHVHSRGTPLATILGDDAGALLHRLPLEGKPLRLSDRGARAHRRNESRHRPTDAATRSRDVLAIECRGSSPRRRRRSGAQVAWLGPPDPGREVRPVDLRPARGGATAALEAAQAARAPRIALRRWRRGVPRGGRRAGRARGPWIRRVPDPVLLRPHRGRAHAHGDRRTGRAQADRPRVRERSGARACAGADAPAARTSIDGQHASAHPPLSTARAADASRSAGRAATARQESPGARRPPGPRRTGARS